MDIDEEITKLLTELVRLSQKRQPEQMYRNLTLLNLQLLAYLYFNDTRPTMHEVANTMDLSLPSASVMVDRLEAEGWLLRTRSEQDRRIVQVQLTAKGRELIKVKIDESSRSLKTALTPLSDHDKQVVLDFFKAYTTATRAELEA